jgi:exodeoxyribonuclease VII small subunit
MSETPDNALNATENADFETALEELETLVEALEGGDLSLEDSLKAFERGVALTRHCQEALRAAEQRVAILAGDGDAESLEAFADNTSTSRA